jgi:hypothetical protein
VKAYGLQSQGSGSRLQLLLLLLLLQSTHTFTDTLNKKLGCTVMGIVTSCCLKTLDLPQIHQQCCFCNLLTFIAFEEWSLNDCLQRLVCHGRCGSTQERC